MTLLAIILIPLLGSVGAARIATRRGTRPAAIAGAAVTATLALAATQWPAVVGGVVVEARWAWMPRLGLELVLRLDGLSFLFVLLVLMIGVLVVLYARYYLDPDEPWGRFYGLLLLFMAAMLGLVMSGNLIQLLICWELTSIVSFLLIGFWKHRADARQGARQALMITGIGGLGLLGGVLMIGEVVGSYDLEVVLRSGDLIRAHDWYVPILLLVLLGAFTKSAQFPFHFWLPHAMAAPTPVSAYLHSATMVKAGVFLIARLFPALAGTQTWFFVVGTTGMVTLVFGAYTALFKHDLKGLLAYSTISHLGLITLLFGLGTPLGEVAALFHIVNHATFKASLFMAVGVIDHECGTRDMRKINGLFKYMPHTAILAMVSASAMAGVPLLNGFLSKEMFLGETLQVVWLGPFHWILPATATLGSVLAVAYSARFVHDVFFNGEPVDLPKDPHEAPRWMLVPIEALVFLCVVVGLFPQMTVAGLLHVAGAAVVAPAPLPPYSLSLWHGFNVPLLMSAIGLVGGVALYTKRYELFRAHRRLFPEMSGKVLADDYLSWLFGASRTLTRRLDRGGLRGSLRWLVVVVVAAAALPHVLLPGVPPEVRLTTDVDPVSLLAGVLLVAVAALTLRQIHDALTSLVLVGVIGLIVSLAFARLSAPDLALTQIVVEVATTVLLILGLTYLPAYDPPEPRSRRQWIDGALAAIAGIGAAALSWALLTRPFEGLAEDFLRLTVPEGGGANAVNVILADFRGFDTFGEATVLGIAGLVVYSLLERVRLTPPSRDAFGRLWDPDRRPLILAQLSSPVLPLALTVACFLFLRGHDEPGGGFVAGLVVGLAFVLQYMARGIAWATPRLAPDYRPLVGAGLLVATVAGAGAWAFDAPFLSQDSVKLALPIVGKVKIATATFFEAGVLVTVSGTLLLILTELGKLSARARRRA